MTSVEIRQKFLDFFKTRGHVVLPSASLIPQNDPTVLFTTAGMQQFKSYYTGEKDPQKDFGSKNVVTVQKCIRTGDIEEVGDDTHLTFFEMLGNFSFGGYWKKEAIEYAYEFITKELRLVIDYVSVFEGDKDTPADDESRAIWQKIDPELLIKNHSRVDNFWGPVGEEGPCGPTTEIYINGVEIWNIVFNEFYKTKSGAYEPLAIKGIDTGMGLERLMVQVQKKQNVYETDLFNGEQSKEERIVADHVKASLFLVSDGVKSSNTGQGYVLRKLLRILANFKEKNINTILGKYSDLYKDIYPINIKDFSIEFDSENQGFKNSQLAVETKLIRDKHLYTKEHPLTGYAVFNISSTFGTKSDYVLQKATELHIPFSEDIIREINDASKQHQEKSRTASAGMFKGGLANTGEQTTRLHTAHHLLLAALQQVLGKDVKQRGSNITDERLRMDFSFGRKMTDEEKKSVESLVNEWVQRDFSVVCREMSKTEAEKIGAEMEFGARYPDVVSVYFVENGQGITVSKEFCGGPHVSHTGELGVFKIQKEEAVASGVRRIKAVLL